ncbi:MAG: efflux RND transporter periplasmic adaptor subunit [Burkholderiales bacterium]|jgi:cobalt-zinc-cadmium efflux system membrane fusion protein|nr:efflux RND transporter periplasmic adaptor subunit [Burkholderiales bacterium]
MLKNKRVFIMAIIGLIVLIALAIYGISKPENEQRTGEPPNQSVEPNVVILSEPQAKTIKVETVTLQTFTDQREAVGYVDFNQDRTVSVFSPWEGRITQVLVKAGDDVKKGQPLYTLDSPDLIEAESALIFTAGALELATQTLARLKKLIEIQGTAQKELEQAAFDHQTAEADHEAARSAVRIFGKSEADIDQIISSRKTNGRLAIVSPFSGRVIARHAAHGMLVQPGSEAPAPITVADISSMWMIANVSEHFLPRIRLDAKATISVMAHPEQSFEGRITHIGSAVDPHTRTVAVRSEIQNPGYGLLPQMLATFVIHTGEPVRSPALPQNGLVRQSDSSMIVFVTQDGLRFERRSVKTGMTQNGMHQILEGLSPEEKVATDGALFLSNAWALSAR